MQSEQQTSADPALPGVDRVNAPLMTRLRSALAAKGSAYQPRTHHLEPDASPKYINRLILETSPYLLQHAHNPVNWFPWSEEAFERARREGKPVLVSVGYSTCHWCHVMERESFEDEEIARYINQNYIAIKVDREERPDVDDLYMKAVQTLTGRGGWPMTVVLTPAKEPFFGGTYFPARDGDRGGSKGFLTLLRELKAEYTANRDKVLARARQLSRHIQAASTPGPSGSVPGADAIVQVVDNAKASFDSSFGGFGRAPKFPRPVLLELLLRYQRRTRDAEALEMVTVTLERMAAGGIYDQVGGGFHRYSTDARWLVPHFEKMLYDNAELVPLYLDAYQITGQERYAEVARDVLHYIAREMTAPEGAFYSATDADSPTPSGHHEEGYFFTWTPSEIEAVLDEELAHTAALFFGVTLPANFEGRNILHVPRSESTVALELGIAVVELKRRLTEIRQQLYAARSQRKAPERDHKLLTSWNGLMISAFARAALVLGDHDYASRAQRAADFVLRNLQKADGRLLRSFNDGHARYEGYLDDYAFLIQALLDLYEATASPQHIEQATSLQKILDQHFWDHSSGGYFMTSEAHEPLLARDKPTYDGAEPSGNSVAVMNLLRLAEITGQQPYRQRAEQSLSAFAHALAQSPGAYPKLLSALEYYLDRPLEVFLILPPDNTDPEPLLAAFRGAYLPNRVFTMTREGPELDRLTKLVPALQDKRALGGRPTAFVCERGRCELPTSDSQVFRQQLAKVQKLVPSD